MLRCMYSGISGMKVNQTKLDVIGNNIANVSTTGFKSSSARFKDMLYQNAGEATSPTGVLGGTNAKQVGLGAQLSSINKVMGQGNALSTGRSLDVCIDGDGYLVVTKGDTYTGSADAGITIDQATGLATGTVGSYSETLYTRDGNLTLDQDGNLLTSDGHRVMGYYLTDSAATTKVNSLTYKGDATTAKTADGEPSASYVDADSKNLQLADASIHPLAIPDSVIVDSNGTKTLDPVKQFNIGKDGVITVVLGSGKRSAIGQIAMSSFKNPEGLTEMGGNMAINSSNSGAPTYITGINKETANANDNSKGFGSIIQGALEGSNVDLTEQFTDMITASRSFQASSKMITTGDEILQTITGLIR